MHSRLRQVYWEALGQRKHRQREGVALWFPNMEGHQSGLITQAFWNL